jgi:glutaredoxin
MENRKEMVELSGALSVPVIVIDDEIVVGWDEGKVRRLLGL